MADPISSDEASDMAAVTIADLYRVVETDGQGAAVSTAVALMYGAAGFLVQVVGPVKLQGSIRHLLTECQIQADLQAVGSRGEARH